ncbi:uncharacterized protein CMU_027610 [Cryptosporidium muris RN66]|uniref:Vesicle transport protein n=1 Tax=Cryptosporidium muris (strain RN66) TaxID=441375 RepID=B6ABJ9_CRYMR|nr:uncharacterized protein CMU_027610 [Cryptosporidium muris RN66]EEA05751.1 hypothetical protein, conserved [Cryptosporidium muris RN66]|eukprot:XP_002140100.1 hypothetical protein [Cryptosporidium muris RN66]
MLTGAADSARNILYRAQQKVQETTESFSPQRWFSFFICITTSFLFLFLSFLFLPMVVVSPHKFAVLFTLGSIFFMASFVVMKGFLGFMKYLTQRERLPFSFIYCASLALTLYGTLVIKSYLLTSLFSLIQIIALASFLATNFPGGSSMMTYIGNNILGNIKQKLSFQKDLPLPI